VLGIVEFPISDVLDDGLNGTYEMMDADGNGVGSVEVNINFEEGDGTCDMGFANVISLLCMHRGRSAF